MKIFNAQGDGDFGWEIDSRGHGHILSFNNDILNMISNRDGKVFTWPIVPYDYDANDTIQLIRNIDQDRNLFITDLFLASDTATDYILHHTDEADFTPTGTTVTAVTTNRTKKEPGLATCKADETENVRGNITLRMPLVANTPIQINTRGSIILGYDDCFAVDLVTAGTMAYSMMVGYFEDKI